MMANATVTAPKELRVARFAFWFFCGAAALTIVTILVLGYRQCQRSRVKRRNAEAEPPPSRELRTVSVRLAGGREVEVPRRQSSAERKSWA